ncbi:MAG: HNH endonuclease [Chloroflexota bacterium]|nr:HNH endonuclease [Chloroflexota bacterium]
MASATSLTVFRRDRWTCRYCGGRTIAPPVLRALSSLYPDEFPYHPNWKAGQVHPGYLLLSTTLDHVNPGSRGGSWGELHNLVAACWPCNSGKGDFRLDEIGWQLLAEPALADDWDGLTGIYPAVWEVAGRPDAQYHGRWLRALRAAAAQD